MHSAIDDPTAIDRTFVRAIFEYPFVQLKLRAVFAMVDSTNSRALDIDRRLGFKEIHRLEAAGLDGDLLILQMLPSECRWINGKEKRSGRS